MVIQQFIIINKIERAKELLNYREMNLSEIFFLWHLAELPTFITNLKKLLVYGSHFLKNQDQIEILY